MNADFLQITVHILLAIMMAGAVIVVSHIFGQRGRAQATKDSPYECGIKTEVEPVGPFSLKFYKVAMLFILFDIELALLLPWAFSFHSATTSGVDILIPGLVFIGLISLGLYYEIKKGGLQWER